MPIKGDAKKQFSAMREMVKDSVTLSAKLLVEKGLEMARKDSIIMGATEKITTRTGKKRLKFLETPEMDRYSKAGKRFKARRVFNTKKFVDREGALLKSFTPAGTWSGNRLPTMANSEIEIQRSDKEAKAVLKFTGTPERALSHPGGRRPMDAFKKVANVWNSFLKKELDKRAREFK